MDSSASFDQLVHDIDEFASSLNEVLAHHQSALTAAESTGDLDEAAEAKRRVLLVRGQLEATSAIRATAIEARDVLRLPFDRMVGALEGSYLHMENTLDVAHATQQRAFASAMAGGSRWEYDRATEEMNIAVGRFEAVTRWLHHTRRLA